MSDDHDKWGTRLADVRVPSWYGAYAVLLVLSALVGALRKRKAWNEAGVSIREAAAVLTERMVEGDQRDERVADLTEQMATMTERMESYGRTSVKLAAASLAVALAALVVAVVVAVTQ